MPLTRGWEANVGGLDNDRACGRSVVTEDVGDNAVDRLAELTRVG